MKRIFFILMVCIIITLGLYYVYTVTMSKTVTDVWGRKVRIYPGCELTQSGYCVNTEEAESIIDLGGPPGLCGRKGINKCKKNNTGIGKCQFIDSTEARQCYDSKKNK